MTQSNWSVSETEVVTQIHDRLDGDRTDVLATIVKVEGNAYRRPGAKMLLDEGGTGVGSITAGCLEDELLRAGERVREESRAELVTYDLMADDDVWGLGVGCDGILEVLLEPLTESHRPAVETVAAGRDVAVLTVLDGGDRLVCGDRAYFFPGEETLSSPAGDRAVGWPPDLLEPAALLADQGRSDTVEVDTDGRTLRVFVDGLKAPTELVVFGTGHDVGPVTEFGAKTDFRVTVVGFRGGIDLEERFPHASRTLTTSPGALTSDLEITDRTYAVVMTHNFVDDRLTVEQLLDSPASYIGLMGPHERFKEMLEAFDREGRAPEQTELDRVYTPIGLDLGGGAPYQIASSIIAEVTAVSHGRTPGHLRERTGHIHDRIDIDTVAEAGVSKTDD